jgi:hypothetical protein
MQVYNNNRARAQGRNGFFFSVFVVSLWTRWKRAVVNTALKLPCYNFYDLLLIVTLRRLECGLKFYDFLIDIEEEIEGLLTSIADCVNPEGTAFRRPTLPSIIRIGYSCVRDDGCVTGDCFSKSLYAFALVSLLSFHRRSVFVFPDVEFDVCAKNALALPIHTLGIAWSKKVNRAVPEHP